MNVFACSLDVKQFFLLYGFHDLHEFMTHYLEMHFKYNFDKYFA